AGNQREDKIHRADVLVVRRIHEAPPSSRMMLVSIVCAVCRSCIASHCSCPSTSSLSPALLRATGRGYSGRTAVIRCVFLFRLLDPRGVLPLVHHADNDRHEGMVLAAEFRALTVICAFALGFEPCLVDASRDRVDLDAERGNRK